MPRKRIGEHDAPSLRAVQERIASNKQRIEELIGNMEAHSIDRVQTEYATTIGACFDKIANFIQSGFDSVQRQREDRGDFGGMRRLPVSLPAKHHKTPAGKSTRVAKHRPSHGQNNSKSA